MESARGMTVKITIHKKNENIVQKPRGDLPYFLIK